jgi:small-conductance mechanosensitive channel
MTKFIIIIIISALQLIACPCFAATPVQAPPGKSSTAVPKTSPVILDGKKLFSVQELGSFSSEERANSIARRIKKAAEDLTVRTDSIKTVDTDISTDVVAGDLVIMSVVDRDAAATGQTRQDIAREDAGKIRTSIESYRKNYSRKTLLLALIYTVIAAAIFILLLVIANRLFRKLKNLIDSRYKERLHSIQIKTIEIVRVQRVRAFVDGSVKFLHLTVILIIVYTFIHFVLEFFPWTKPFAGQLLGYVLLPLKVIGGGIVKYIPNLMFIVVLVFVTRYILKLMSVFFMQIEQGGITFSGFYPEWAKPTYRITRFLVIAFAAVVAFPYIPGSASPAFKGVSIFVGVLFSLGSQSTVSNVLAGFTMTYRRLFKVGDRVRIGDIVGDVEGIRLQVTHLHTVKNEEVMVPNSTILNSNVTNYSSLCREKPLILHTSVSIGYDAPWRQVHALLLIAAERTLGLLRDPAPFVLQKSLDDFYVSYELNVYTDTPQMMAVLYSEIHKNIQDCFNEYGVQIMSPNYRADRAVPTVVPKDRWYEPPAKAPENDNQQ